MSARTILSYFSQLERDKPIPCSVPCTVGNSGPGWSVEAEARGLMWERGGGVACTEALNVLCFTAVFIQTLECSLATLLISKVIQIFGGAVDHSLHIY